MVTQKILTRDFILGFSAQFALSAVFFILLPTLPIYLQKLAATDVEIGILVGILSISSLVLRPFVGRALLKIPERDFMIAGSILFIFSSIAYLFVKPFWPLLIVRVFQGIGWALFATASLTLVTRIIPEAHRGQSLSYFYLAFNVAFALAPAFGMFLINLFSFTILFLVSATLSLCSLLITLKLRRSQGVPLEKESSQAEDRRFLSREALPLAIMAFMGNIIWGAVTAFFPLYALNNGVSNPGFFFAVYAIVLILCRSLGGQIMDSCSRENVIFPCLVTIIIAMTLLSFSSTFTLFILVAVIWGIGNSFFFPSLLACTLDLAGSSRSTAIGTYLALSDLGAGIGSVIMGAILQLSSYRTMFLCLALTGVVNLFYFQISLRKKGGNQHANLRISV